MRSGADGEPVTWQRLVGLGIFGGMIPCPSAIVVMLSAIALHRVGLGLVLIVAFSFGLAAVLTAIGFLVVYAQRSDFLRRAMDRAESSGGLAATMVRLVPDLRRRPRNRRRPLHHNPRRGPVLVTNT